jgi:DNA-binding HxlR family transcriptional regulator
MLKPPKNVAPERRLENAGCRLDYFLKVLAREWMSHILWILAREEVVRFGELRRSLPGKVSARVLSRRLKELESYGLVSRNDAGQMPLRVEYALTDDGRLVDAALRHNEMLAGNRKRRTGAVQKT